MIAKRIFKNQANQFRHWPMNGIKATGQEREPFPNKMTNTANIWFDIDPLNQEELPDVANVRELARVPEGALICPLNVRVIYSTISMPLFVHRHVEPERFVVDDYLFDEFQRVVEQNVKHMQLAKPETVISANEQVSHQLQPVNAFEREALAGGKILVCKLCSACFASSSGLNRHLARQRKRNRCGNARNYLAPGTS